jgi:hypothetical protein
MWTGVVIAQYPEWRDGALDGGKIVIVLLCDVLRVQEECEVSEGEPAMTAMGVSPVDPVGACVQGGEGICGAYAQGDGRMCNFGCRW